MGRKSHTWAPLSQTRKKWLKETKAYFTNVSQNKILRPYFVLEPSSYKNSKIVVH
jgi:hypothetical protein